MDKLPLNRAWQPLPGAREIAFYPYIRTPDVLSSNSFLMQTEERIILIDPGALEEQTREIIGIIRDVLRKKPLPVFIHLTHCHIDHSLHISRYFDLRSIAPVVVIAPPDAAMALAAGDAQFTIADLYHIACPPVKVDVILDPARGIGISESSIAEAAEERHISMHTETIETPAKRVLCRIRIDIAPEQQIELYWTPGHSNDSMCIRLGRLLFIGDILAAVHPMVAGISGWSREDYIATLDNLIWLLPSIDVALICPGHGGYLPAGDVVGILKKLRDDAAHMGEVAVMDKYRLRQTTEHALDLLEDAKKIFTAVAGRLYYVAYYLEELEEVEAAGHYRQLMEADRIDACLMDFERIADELNAGEKSAVDFAHRALSIVQRIRKLFETRGLENVVPRSLLNRARLLLIDFINATKGMRNLEEFIPTDINTIMGNIMQEISETPLTDTAIIDLADDHEKYLAGLVSRIAYRPALENLDIIYRRQDDPPFIRIAAKRFQDTLIELLEVLALRGCSSVGITAERMENKFGMVLTPEWMESMPPLTPHETRSFSRRFEVCGARWESEGNTFAVTASLF
ncbi:MAG: hypothetical protein C0394_03780 [Syntrophus sp. (in: bacteria)]|nr:hypothetical protein [Syntrophus sp. (in: bacteria)]